MKKSLEQKIGYQFKRKDLLEQALTHSSLNIEYNYERLEFLGDRVLGLAVAALLYKKFPDEKEGDIAKRYSALVQKNSLYKIALSIDLGDHLLLSSQEELTGGREKDSILSDGIESLLGAVFLDGGYTKAAELVNNLFDKIAEDYNAPPQDPKTELQEILQAKGLPLPIYHLKKQEGPSHAPVFTIQLQSDVHGDIEATGSSKREAEKKVAEKLLHLLQQTESSSHDNT